MFRYIFFFSDAFKDGFEKVLRAVVPKSLNKTSTFIQNSKGDVFD